LLHIIDDEEGIRELLASFAKLTGFESKVFCSANSYLEYLESDSYVPPKALITDINMPDSMGCVVSHPLKSKYPDVTLIVMSGFLEQCDTRCCKRHRAHGLIDYSLPKPFKMAQLIEILEAIR